LKLGHVRDVNFFKGKSRIFITFRDMERILSTRLAQDLIAKKWGVIDQEESLEDMTLHQYLQLYQKPPIDDSMQAIKSLEVAVDKKKKTSKSHKSVKNPEKKKKGVSAKPLKDLLTSKKPKKGMKAPAKGAVA
jgi:hypothetical protein